VYKTTINSDGKTLETLTDILPASGHLKILFIAKTPAMVSVEAGHYFQGRQGKMFWNKLSEYNILNVPDGKFEDDFLLANKFGITDIVKVPRNYGNEPSEEEYRSGLERILLLIRKYEPKVIVFVYKAVLDTIIRLSFGLRIKATYGFNEQLERYFGSKVFVFPMPGTPCTREDIIISMTALRDEVNK
jgi:mismatch-specific thymine-DNA glycosylase